MGLAASQARFLGITARKSNIEYEGQQVNQQRTALAEEVNALYNKLLSLDLPVAPNTTDFYESNYSFDVSNTDGYDGSYIVKSYFPNADEEGTYYLNLERTYNKTVAVGTVYDKSKVSYSEETGQYTFTDNGGNEYVLQNASESSNKSIAALINDTYGEGTIPDPDNEKFYYYQDSNGQTHYISSTQLADGSQSKFSEYISTNKSVTESVVFNRAHLTFDANNRMSGISSAYVPGSEEPINLNTEVNTTRTYDTEGYDAALRDYTMSKEEYDKEVAELNAQTESLQQEDKVLELRLNQIDTEQNELKTELDAIKKVLEDNIDKTFKTFA